MRDDFSQKTKDTLAKRVGMKCSNPNCRNPTSGPTVSPTKSINVGVAAHISAAAPDGPRYNPSLTSAERTSIENGIWLCQTCAKLIDSDEVRYTPVLLRHWRELAESAAAEELEISPPTRAANKTGYDSQPSKALANFANGIAEKSSETIATFLSQSLLLLLADRYPVGVWGRSLAASSAAYGHGHDPGSITVTCYALEALQTLFPKEVLPEVASFRDFLVERKIESGAVGMRKLAGAEHYPEYAITAHARHTAVAARFFEEHRSLDHALDCLKFIISAQDTKAGAWAAVPGTKNAQPDPLTTAYVLRTLRDFQNLGLFEKLSQKNLVGFAASYWERGILWLLNELKDNDLWWLYKTTPDPKTRAHEITVDILHTLPELAGANSAIHGQHSAIMESLAQAWRKNGQGIPAGIRGDKADLFVSAAFVLTAWRLQHRYGELLVEFLPKFFANLHGLLNGASSNAAGWSTAITMTREIFPSVRLTRHELENTRRRATELWTKFDKEGREAALEMIKGDASWVRQIVAGAILPEKMKPL